MTPDTERGATDNLSATHHSAPSNRFGAPEEGPASDGHSAALGWSRTAPSPPATPAPPTESPDEATSARQHEESPSEAVDPPDRGVSADPQSSADDGSLRTESTPPPVDSPTDEPVLPPVDSPPFILYKSGSEFSSALSSLVTWVHGLLLPVYGREVSSAEPWCTRWFEHMEAVAQLYGLWMAWQELTGERSSLSGPAAWHRDYLTPVMMALRNPSGPFAGCKPGQHRAKQPPPTE
ncbi:DUF4913 domain-containing protein [Streptomyces sp. NPDC058394]|uniref:DUF4913 domain-containing protein n=1 Tax=Streptomyces sp. NPDC058394 TaxID=3346477 RepID=UPI00365604C0